MFSGGSQRRRNYEEACSSVAQLEYKALTAMRYPVRGKNQDTKLSLRSRTRVVESYFVPNILFKQQQRL